MRYALSEGTNILAKFPTGSTVTFALYKISDESTITLTSASGNEIGSTGVFKWNTSNITTQPTSLTEYLWTATDTISTQYGKIVLGGYPDYIDAKISEIPAAPSASTVADTVWNEAKSDHVTAGTMGEAMTFMRKVLGWLRSLL